MEKATGIRLAVDEWERTVYVLKWPDGKEKNLLITKFNVHNISAQIRLRLVSAYCYPLM